jgi:hypothetical protein
METPKILVKRIAPSLVAVPDLGDEKGFFYPLNTIYALVARKPLDTSYLYLAALLNSRLLDWYYKLLFEAISVRGGYIEYREYLKYLPIRRISFRTPAREREQLLERGTETYGRYLETPADSGAVLEFVEQQLAADPGRADVVHDLLAFLAGRMIEMNQRKQSETSGFLKWLERAIGVPIDGLRNKTRIRSYHEHNPGELLDVLRSNRRKLGAGVDPSAPGFRETLEKELAASLEKLAPLKAGLDATDGLIDRIVYRLHGLTDTEVRQVEENGGKSRR